MDVEGVVDQEYADLTITARTGFLGMSLLHVTQNKSAFDGLTLTCGLPSQTNDGAIRQDNDITDMAVVYSYSIVVILYMHTTPLHSTMLLAA